MPGSRSIRDQMQGVAPSGSKVYGSPMGPAQAAPGAQRPSVGQAPIDVQRRAIAQHDAEASRQARAGLYQKPVGSQASAAPVPRPQPGAQNLGVQGAQPAPSVMGAAQQIQGRPAMVDQAVKDAS